MGTQRDRGEEDDEGARKVRHDEDESIQEAVDL